jgi:hypothetical protein
MIQLLFTARYSFDHPDSNQMLNRLLRAFDVCGPMVNDHAHRSRSTGPGQGQAYEII